MFNKKTPSSKDSNSSGGEKKLAYSTNSRGKRVDGSGSYGRSGSGSRYSKGYKRGPYKKTDGRRQGGGSSFNDGYKKTGGDGYKRTGGGPSKGRKGGYNNFRHKRVTKQKYIHTELSDVHMDKSFLKDVPPLENNVRVILFGGVEEVGKNMSAIECGDTIVIVDCGTMFGTAANMPGISSVLPNIRYLEENKHKIKGMVVTHGHLDHIGGIQFLIERLGYPPIYSRPLTNLLIKRRQSEVIGQKELEYNEVDKDSVIDFGEGIVARFYNVTHTIPDSMGIIFETPVGDIVFTGDVKLDHTDGEIAPDEIKEYGVFKKRETLCLLADSTNAERPGYSIPEWKVWQNLDDIILKMTGRIIMGAFASQLERVTHVINSASKAGKKIILDGRSMKNNTAIIQELGSLKVDKGTIIPIEDMHLYDKDKIIILATGAQGDRYASLDRISNKTHKNIKLERDDIIVLSSSVIPGNELAVQRLKDNLSRQGARIITYQVSDVHASGHAYRAELEWIHAQIRSQFFVPIHGYHYMLKVHGEIAEIVGTKKENVMVPDNGSIIDFNKDDNGEVKASHYKDKLPKMVITVDGVNVSEIQDMVIRDRRLLADDGIFTIILLINQHTRRLKKSPDIISRGFVYLRQSQNLLQESRMIVKKSVESTIRNMDPINMDIVRRNVTRELEDYLFQKTTKRPIVIPTILLV